MSEAASAVDSINGLRTSLSAMSEAASAAEVITGLLTILAPVSEAGAAADQGSATSQLAAAMIETAAASDIIDSLANQIDVEMNETANAVDEQTISQSSILAIHRVHNWQDWSTEVEV
jgi:hypothetical protein